MDDGSDFTFFKSDSINKEVPDKDSSIVFIINKSELLWTAYVS